MPCHTSNSQAVLRGAADVEIDKKPWDLEKMVQEALSRPLGCHKAVHALRQMDDEDGPIRKAIEKVLGDSWLPEKLSTLWKVTYDFASTEELEDRSRRQRQILIHITSGMHDLYDLILYDILNCPQCYKFCLGKEKPDQVFFCLAAKAEQADRRDHVLFRGSPQMLFRLAADNKEWLQTCHDKLPVTLPPQEIGAFSIADIDLNELMGLN